MTRSMACESTAADGCVGRCPTPALLGITVLLDMDSSSEEESCPSFACSSHVCCCCRRRMSSISEIIAFNAASSMTLEAIFGQIELRLSPLSRPHLQQWTYRMR